MIEEEIATAAPSTEAVEAALEAQSWTYAKTMPECPHEYVMKRAWASDLPFPEVVSFIRRHGYAERSPIGNRAWWKRFNVGDWQYFTLWEAPDFATVINRARLEPEPEDDAPAPDFAAIGVGPDEGVVLDVGCGSSRFLDSVTPDGYVGLDTSRARLGRLLRAHPGTDARLMRFEEYRGRQRFDLIVAAGEVSPERIDALLAPGGRFVQLP